MTQKPIPDFSLHQWNGWGGVIRLVREQLGFNQRDFGDILGVWSQQEISDFEREKAEPPIEFWRGFASLWRLSMNYVLMGIGDPFAPDDFDPDDIEKREKALEQAIREAQDEERTKAVSKHHDWKKFTTQPPPQPKKKS